MKTAEVIKAFNGVVDGEVYPRKHKPGAILRGNLAEAAIQGGYAKAITSAPVNKAFASAPVNKEVTAKPAVKKFSAKPVTSTSLSVGRRRGKRP